MKEKKFYWDDSEIQSGISEFVCGKEGFDTLTVYDRRLQALNGRIHTERYFDFSGAMPDGTYFSHEKLRANSMEEAKREVEQIYLEQCRTMADRYRRYAKEYGEKATELEKAIQSHA